jgi:FAS-associated factor 2
MREAQDEAYKQMIEKKRQDLEKAEALANQQKLEEDSKNQAANKKAKLKDSFEKEKIDDGPDSIAIAFRMPNGSRNQRNFRKSDTVERIYNFVSVLDERGFENEENDFKIVAGFPAQTLNPRLLLRDQFPDSDHELVHVKELDKDS